MKAKQIEAEVEIEKQRKAAEHAKAIREQKARENGGDSSTVIAGIDPVLHNNIVADLRQEISSLKEQLTLKGNVTASTINDLDSNDHARSKRSLEDTRIVETKDQSTSTEDLIVFEDRVYDEKFENWGSEVVLQSKPIVSEIVQDELLDIVTTIKGRRSSRGCRGYIRARCNH
uniref:hypothetical protein n=1 Tax=Rickettsia endosymbiont of Ixodes pacificus TaxID=1133329 RepID=UPI00067A5BB8|nr:hypothetical protein [Rickettsia endosymbiont of Ixodes pacificus]AKS10316.1 hypothetical protein REIP_p070 [Rickettsia endosymbiont of Ixodes pacificus]